MIVKRKKTKQETPSPVSLVSTEKSSNYAEQCRIILNNIKFSSVRKTIKSVAVTSSWQGEGKSTIASNLAIIASENGQKVLLVDCDLRRPTVGLSFILSTNHGLTNILTSEIEKVSSYKQKSGIGSLDIITSGPKPPNPSELLYSKRMEDFMNEVYDEYEFIIYDCPPVLGMTDTQLVASKTDGVLLVARQEVTKK